MSSPWNAETFKLGRFSPEELAELGVGPDDDWDTAMAKVKDQALEEWTEREAGIEAMVEEAEKAIALYPNDRDNAMARTYGEFMSQISDIETGEVDGEQMLLLFTFAVFKLAEARVEIAKLSDGNYRTGEAK